MDLHYVKRITDYRAIEAVQSNSPLPDDVYPLTKEDHQRLSFFATLRERKQSLRLHGSVDWTRDAVDIIYNWCLAYRGMWSATEAYSRFLSIIERIRPTSIISVDDYETYFAAVFYEILANVEGDKTLL